jgi:hypothetical protein
MIKIHFKVLKLRINSLRLLTIFINKVWQLIKDQNRHNELLQQIHKKIKLQL